MLSSDDVHQVLAPFDLMTVSLSHETEAFM